MGPGPSGSILAFHPDVCKRRYGLDLVMMRLKHTSEVDIHAAILTRNLIRLLRFLFGLILEQGQAEVGRAKMLDSMVIGWVSA